MLINFSTSPGIFRWKPAAWLRVSGPDAASFLQGQFSQDLRPLGFPPESDGAAGAVYGLWLTVKGRVEADSFVLRGATREEFWVGSYGCAAAVIRARLESFIIADDVVIGDETAGWAGVTLLNFSPVPAAADGVLVFAGRRGPDVAVEMVYRAEQGEPAILAAARAAGAADVGPPEMERRRIAGRVPAVPRDLGPGDLPNEGGLETVAVAYTKGCYLGQEVMARLKAMGQVRRQLVRVAAAAAAVPVTPAPVFAGGKAAGELRSAVDDGAGGWIGLALVSRLNVGTAAMLALTAEGAATIRLLDTP